VKTFPLEKKQVAQSGRWRKSGANDEKATCDHERSFGVMLRDVPGHKKHVGGEHRSCCPDVLVFAANVHDHITTINGHPWNYRRIRHLDGVPGATRRTLLDYGLANGKVFEMDARKFQLDSSIRPQAAISVPFPDFIYPHRPMDIAFRDGTDAGPHHAAVPGALVFQYDAWTQPVIKPDNIRPTHSIKDGCGRQPDYFFLYAGLKDPDFPDERLIHARHAWCQFTRHWKGMCFELFGAVACEPVIDTTDPAGISDSFIESLDSVHPWKPGSSGLIEARAANCKVQTSFVSNGMKNTLMLAME
jgi:hypothetical protein